MNEDIFKRTVKSRNYRRTIEKAEQKNPYRQDMPYETDDTKKGMYMNFENIGLCNLLG